MKTLSNYINIISEQEEEEVISPEKLPEEDKVSEEVNKFEEKLKAYVQPIYDLLHNNRIPKIKEQVIEKLESDNSEVVELAKHILNY